MKKLIPFVVAMAMIASGWQGNLVAQEKEKSDEQATEQTTEDRQVEEKKPERPRRNKPPEWTERFDKRFVQQTPMLNDYAPNARGFDEEGNKFKLSSTDGKYTVLVFGCLT